MARPVTGTLAPGDGAGHSRPVKARRGRILAVKWGMNPNSSSLGVDVTFLLLGATAVALATPVIGALLRARRPRLDPAPAATAPRDPRA